MGSLIIICLRQDRYDYDQIEGKKKLSGLDSFILIGHDNRLPPLNSRYHSAGTSSPTTEIVTEESTSV
jgi:hypothetical protein